MGEDQPYRSLVRGETVVGAQTFESGLAGQLEQTRLKAIYLRGAQA